MNKNKVIKLIIMMVLTLSAIIFLLDLAANQLSKAF